VAGRRQRLRASILRPNHFELRIEPKMKRQRNRRTALTALRGAGLCLVLGVAVGCVDWNEYGNGATNPHNSSAPGPSAGIVGGASLAHPVPGQTHDVEVGVLTDSAGAYIVTSYSNEIHVYDPAGAYQDTLTLPITDGDGPRASPYIVNDYLGKRSTLFTGCEAGGFYVVEIDKNTAPYTLTLKASLSSSVVGASESSPKRSSSGVFFLAGMFGDIQSFQYNFVTATLSLTGTYSLAEEVPGAIALYNLDGSFAGDEVLVATKRGRFHVLDSALSTVLWSETSGVRGTSGTNDQYYAGVTVAERGLADPIALLPIAHRIGVPAPANAGMLRAINLSTQSVEWELTPSGTTLGQHEIPGSVSLMHPFLAVTPLHAQVFWDLGEVSGKVEATSVYLPAAPPLGCEDCAAGFTTRRHATALAMPEITLNEEPFDIQLLLSHWATFASTDGSLYAVDLKSGAEMWSYALGQEGLEAPVTDQNNIVYVGDGSSVLHAVHGASGAMVWTDSSLSTGGTGELVKLGVHYGSELIAGAHNAAYWLH